MGATDHGAAKTGAVITPAIAVVGITIMTMSIATHFVDCNTSGWLFYKVNKYLINISVRADNDFLGGTVASEALYVVSLKCLANILSSK